MKSDRLVHKINYRLQRGKYEKYGNRKRPIPSLKSTNISVNARIATVQGY